MDWQTMAGYIGGLAAVATALVKLYSPTREIWLRFRGFMRRVDDDAQARLDLEQSLKAIRRVAVIKNVLERWATKKGAQRVLLLTANDSGLSWKGEGPLFVNNPAQVTGPGEPNTVKLWQDWKCDPWYIGFLGRLLETHDICRGVALITENDVGGELLDQYRHQGTVCSLVLPFRWLSGSVLWYVSINFGRNPVLPGSEDTPHHLNDEENAAYLDSMRQVYNDRAHCRLLIRELREAWDSIR
jgi:hypothetical protein